MKVVQIKVYRGLKLSYNADGSPQNENQFVKLREGREFDKFIANIKTMGYCKVELESVKQRAGKTGYKDASEKEFEKFEGLLKEAFVGKEVEKVVTVADLSKRMDELAEGNSAKDEEIKGLYEKLEEGNSKNDYFEENKRKSDEHIEKLSRENNDNTSLIAKLKEENAELKKTDK